MSGNGGYAWDANWQGIWDGGDNEEYAERIRRMVMASINWLAEHPTADPKWRELDKRQLMREAGVPAGTDPEGVVIVGAWENAYQPSNGHARHWFRAIARACGSTPDEAPSALMMQKAVACGMLFKRDGWDAFNRFMLTRGETTH